MKRLGFGLILTLLLLTGLSCPALALEDEDPTSGTCGLGLSWQLEGGVLTISGGGYMDNYRPASAPWYPHRAVITSIQIQEGVAYVGSNAFVNELNVTELRLPESLTDIGTDAFPSCGSTSQAFRLTLPGSLTGLGMGALRGCLMREVDLPDSLTELGPEVFRGCVFLEQVSVPASVERIGDQAFQGCVRLTRVTIPASVTRMGQDVFRDCTSLRDIYFEGRRSQWERIAPSLEGCPTVVHCREEDVPLRFTLRFESNGSRLDSEERSVTNGQPYGALPAPTWEGYRFQGWYTEPEGGTLITAESIVALEADQTLYARWKEGEPEVTLKGVERLSFRFPDSAASFGYGGDYRFPLARIQGLYGETAFSASVQELAGPWGSNSFGMCAAAGLLSQGGRGFTPDSFRAGAALPGDLYPQDRGDLGLTLTELIEALQLSQYDSGLQRTIHSRAGDLSKLTAAVTAARDGGTPPPILLLYGPRGGHAVLGYDLVTDGETRVLVYDPAAPMEQRELTLRGGTGWYYSGTGTDAWSDDGGTISYLTFQEYRNLWQQRQTDASMVLLWVESRDAVVWDSSGAVVATIQNGEVLSSRERVYPLRYGGLPPAGTLPGQTALWLPSGETYTVRNTDARTANLTAGMVNADQQAVVSTTAAKVSMAVSDRKGFCAVELPGGGREDYTLTLISTLPGGHQEAGLRGTTTEEETVLAQFAGKLYADGLASGTVLTVDGQEAQRSILSGGVEELNAALAGKPVTSGLPFQDVTAQAWYHDAVAYVYEKGIMSGTAQDRFSPGGTTSRGQVVTMLWRMTGSPQAQGQAFSDVKPGSWYAPAVAWASSAGVVNGKGAGVFAPEAPVTRQEFAAILYRYAEYRNYGPTQAAELGAFSDAGQVSDYAWKPMRWAHAVGLINGVGGGRLSPQGQTDRAQAAAMLMRFVETVEK